MSDHRAADTREKVADSRGDASLPAQYASYLAHQSHTDGPARWQGSADWSLLGGRLLSEHPHVRAGVLQSVKFTSRRWVGVVAAVMTHCAPAYANARCSLQSATLWARIHSTNQAVRLHTSAERRRAVSAASVSSHLPTARNSQV